MKNVLVLCVFLILASYSFGQKQVLTHDVYDNWKDLKEFKLSYKGDYSSYQLNPQKGDGLLLLVENATGKTVKSFARGQNNTFSLNSDFLVFKVTPQADSIRALKLKKAKEEVLPKDSLFIYSIMNDSLYKTERVKSFKLADKESSFLSYLHEKEIEKVQEKTKDTIVQDTAQTIDTAIVIKKKLEGSKLVYWDLKGNRKLEFENVSDYVMSDNGNLLVFKTETKDSIDSVGLFIVDAQTMQKRQVLLSNGYAKGLSVDEIGNRFAFYYSTDTAKIKNYKIIVGEISQLETIDITKEIVKNVPIAWQISENHAITFSNDNKKMFFGTSYIFPELKQDSLLEEEKVKLDIWSWTDSRIQSQQLKSLDKDLKKTYLAVYNFDNNSAIQIADSTMEDVVLKMKGNSINALASNHYPYQYLELWLTDVVKDYYSVNLITGKRNKFATAFSGSVDMSPQGKFAAIYDRNDSTWYLYDTKSQISHDLTSELKVNFYNEESDVPELPSSYGIAGWMKNDRAVVVYDKYDLWMFVAAKDGEKINLTNGFGRRNNIVLRFLKTNAEFDYIDEHQNILLQGFNKITKQSSIYQLDIKTGDLRLLVALPNKISDIVKAENAEIYSFSKSDYNTFPDRLVVNDFGNWNNTVKASDANPQTANYLWGSVELINWVSFDGDNLTGLLYKPENFNPSKKYPMIVYFYEKNSDQLYANYTPRPSRSVINFPLYTSNDYLIFVPDIKYKTGSPGQDAYNCIVSGTYSLIEKSFVDKDRIGLQGQSWGGYQVAYLVTKTNLYKCAMAGAAVSNMTSAYGGIRWETGVGRMFQYEQGQSRIGASLWEDLPAYIENSPLFFAVKVNTPLLLMSNDGDGAVPWTQGIEYFLALKRLNKPTWLLNYNGEEHNLKNRVNCIDLSKRMMQFFDYYLKGKELPKWMEEGIPAVRKGFKEQ